MSYRLMKVSLIGSLILLSATFTPHSTASPLKDESSKPAAEKL
ncbi:MAG TPA: hypothetical protein VLE19_13535 [Pyrinomonadaceae bacterium]|nr:hypothetical protein [Pyrinomonadaceae bacterium]